MDLFYGTGTHYDKNCWVSGEVLWLSARSPSEYAGKRLKMAVSREGIDEKSQQVKTYKLESNDYRYALKIPIESELVYNKIPQNPGWN